MKTIWPLLLVLFSNLCYSQSNPPILEELFSRGPSAKAEAMGKGFAANTENEFGSYYNPALTGLSEGLVINTSFSNRYEFYDKSRFSYWGATYKIKNIVTVGFSRYSFNYGQDFYSYPTDSPYVRIPIGEISNIIYTLNFSRETIKNLYFGINISSVTPNYLFYQSPRVSHTSAVTFDIGILGKVPITDPSPNVSHLLQFGAGFYNITGVEYGYQYTSFGYRGSEKYLLPKFFRVAGSYSMKYKREDIIRNLNIFGFLAHVEVENNARSGTYAILMLGTEITLLDILSLRGGFSFGNTYERSTGGKLNADTYGIGIKIPLNLIFKLNSPLSINIDYLNLKQPPHYDMWNHPEMFDRYNTVSAQLNFVPAF